MLRSTLRFSLIAISVLGGLAGACTTQRPVVAGYPAADAFRWDYDGTSVHYFDFNRDADGLPVVWIHGYSGAGFEAFFLSPYLAGRRIIAPDLPGSGYSAKPAIEYTAEYYLEFIDRFIGGLGVGDYVLVGHSMGGRLAAEFASSSPRGLRGLVLVAPHGLPGQAGPILEFLAGTGVLVDVGLELHNQTILDLAMRLNVFSDPARIPKDLVDYLTVATFHTPGARHAIASVTRNIISNEDDPVYLASVAVPTLVIWGTDDRVLDVRYADVFRDRIDGSELELIADAGHLPHVETPRETAVLIERFVAHLEATGAWK